MGFIENQREDRVGIKIRFVSTVIHRTESYTLMNDYDFCKSWLVQAVIHLC